MLVSDRAVEALVVSERVVDKDSAVLSETVVKAVVGTDTVVGAVGISWAVVEDMERSKPTVVSEAVVYTVAVSEGVLIEMWYF